WSCLVRARVSPRLRALYPYLTRPGSARSRSWVRRVPSSDRHRPWPHSVKRYGKTLQRAGLQPATGAVLRLLRRAPGGAPHVIDRARAAMAAPPTRPTPWHAARGSSTAMARPRSCADGWAAAAVLLPTTRVGRQRPDRAQSTRHP